jgi:ABC-type transport system involved in multi-copper enzyme maturation permease subunit
MNLPAAILVIRQLLRDTLRQSLASRSFWLLLGLTGLCILLCLSVRIEGITATKPAGEIELFGRDKKPYTGFNPGRGSVSFAFGAVRVEMARDDVTAIRFLHSLLAQLAATVGMLLLLLWSSAFLPEFLNPRAVSILLAKPIPRWSLLAGKFLGVLILVALQLTLFVGGTWLALALATGIWHPAFLMSIPLLIVLFVILYSFSALLAVWTRSTVVCIFGTLLFWAVCAAVNQTHYAHLNSSGRASPSSRSSPSPLVETGYWILPKPVDCVLLLTDVLRSEQHFQATPSPTAAARAGVVFPELSILSSLLFCLVLFGAASYGFVNRDF